MTTAVFVVTKGTHSDYRIHQVFSNRAAADAYCELRNAGLSQWADPYQVEDWPLLDVDPGRREVWSASGYLMRDGISTHGEVGDDMPATVITTPTGAWAENYGSKEQARKAVQDHLAQLKAEKAGIA